MNKQLLFFVTISVLCLSTFNNLKCASNGESDSKPKTIILTLEEFNDDNPSLMEDKIVDQGFTFYQARVLSQQNTGNGMWHKELLQQLKPEFHDCEELEPHMLKNDNTTIMLTINNPDANDIKPVK